jgi:beta-lactamase class A
MVVMAATGAGCGSTSSTTATPNQPASSASTDRTGVASATAVALSSPVVSSSPTATAPTWRAGWIVKSATLYSKASDDGPVQVHLGANFPIVLTPQSAQVDGQLWYEASWETPGRNGTGWLPASDVTLTRPTGEASASIDALDEELAEYLAAIGSKIGVVAYDVTRGVTYTYNATHTYFVASSMKVPIMLTFFSQLEAKGREPTTHEQSLLRTMIENSNNNSAESLYEEIGAEKGINAFMKSVGISGLTPGKPGWWGHSTMSPTTMVALLTKLNNGTVLNDKHRQMALGYMTHIDSDGRVGLGDNSPKGATVAMKDGWTTALDGTGTSVVNTSGIVTLGSETYILSVYTDGNRGFAAGWKIVRHVSYVVGERLMPGA